MKAKGKNREIENLFREQFSAFEHKPSPQVWNGFVKRLNRREFLRFNPGKFNAWYLGAIFVTALVSATLLFNTPETNTPDYIPPVDSGETIQPKAAIGVDQVNTEAEIEKISKGSAQASGRVTTVNVNSREKRMEMEGLSDIAVKPASDKGITEKLSTNLVVETGDLSKMAPSSEFRMNISAGCIPLRVSFENISANYDSCLWEFGDGGYSELKSPVWVFDEKGDFQVALISFGKDGQKAVSKQKITVYPIPEARFEISSGEAILPDEKVHFFNYSDNSVSWEWSFGDGKFSSQFEPDHAYRKSGSYSVKLVAISQYGCKDSMIVTNAFDDNSCYIKFPNAFIPNNGGPTGGYFTNWSDERSEVFHPVWSGVTQYQLRIFSRMGVLVFETSDINIGWDGYIRGEKAEPGVYIWKVRGLFKNGDPFVQAGDVTILPKL